MSAPAEKQPIQNSQNGSNKSFCEILSQKQSQELVIALSGPLGSGVKDVRKILKEELELANYTVVVIKVSDLMQDFYKQIPGDGVRDGLLERSEALPTASSTPLERVSKLQALGNYLRETFELQIGALLAMKEISKWRDEHPESEVNPDDFATTNRTAFIIDQLKHPNEADLLQRVYGNIYYQIGVLATEGRKVTRLKKLGFTAPEALQLIEKDRKEFGNHGQQLEKVMLYSDYYISFNSENLPSLKESVSRFLQLTHGTNGLTPSISEVGMYSAYSASLQSACLSRQVGASILDDNGNVLAIGRNDVPKPGGGLYRMEDGDSDFRCIKSGAKCFNTEKLNALENQIADVILNNLKDKNINDHESQEIVNTSRLAKSIARKIKKETTVGSLIEFSRSIHAEMDAIVSLSRKQNGSTEKTTMYTTTFPCHNCARHIVAAGIKKVIYIEPYEKSQAIELHEDSISISGENQYKVSVEAFEGVSPRKFQSFFKASEPRKDKASGEAIMSPLHATQPVDNALLTKYTEVEDRASKQIDERLSQLENSIQTVMAD